MSQYHGTMELAHWKLLAHIHSKGLFVQSNMARMLAIDVALLASNGWITNISPCGSEYGNRWSITAAGLTALQHKELF